MSESLLPDFLIIGAGKSGTTSVDNYLKQHPEIFISPKKEPNFFGYELVSREDLPDDEKQHYENSCTNLKSYKELFSGSREGQVKGETSNTYLYHKTAPERIKFHIPDAKLIVIFRQPTERLYSRYLHLARDNRLPTNKFEDCLDKSTIWWERNDLVKEGFYFKNLSRFYDLFPADQIKVFLFDELRSDSYGVLKKIYDFIGVDTNFDADLSVVYNKSGFVKNPAMDSVFGGGGVVRKVVGKVFSEKGINRLKDQQWLVKKVNDMRNKNLARPKLDVDLKSKITKEVYREDILKLQDLIKEDLSHWMA